MEEEEGGMLKTRSFRDEDYSNRRVFLRSYPLQWAEEDALRLELEEEEEEEEEEEQGRWMSYYRLSLKSKFIALIHWSEGKVLLMRRLKSKVAFYLVACKSFGFKSSNKLITL